MWLVGWTPEANSVRAPIREMMGWWRVGVYVKRLRFPLGAERFSGLIPIDLSWSRRGGERE
jgi:hypothetical protein